MVSNVPCMNKMHLAWRPGTQKSHGAVRWVLASKFAPAVVPIAWPKATNGYVYAGESKIIT